MAEARSMVPGAGRSGPGCRRAGRIAQKKGLLFIGVGSVRDKWWSEYIYNIPIRTHAPTKRILKYLNNDLLGNFHKR